MKKDNAYPEFYNLVETRYSCRDYSDESVSREMILAVIDGARLAPSACNRQPWKFLVADSEELHRAVVDSYSRDWIKNAPVYLIACGIHDEAWHRPHDGKDHTDVDVAIAVEHLCLSAASLGLGTCWVCNFDPEVITRAFNLPEGIEPIAIIPMGYPAPGSVVPAKKRKSIDEILKWGKY